MVRAASTFVIVLVAFVVGTFPTLQKIALRWTEFDEAYSHGLMIFGVAIYLIFRAWRAQPPKAGFYPVWLLPLALFIGIYTVGGILYVEAVQQFMLVPILLMAFAVACGFRTMMRFLLPIGVLVFAIPFWDYIAWPLQLLTVEINKLLLSLWGIEFEVEGVLVFLTGVGAFEIAHGCSGLRYVLVSMSLATIYSELNYRLWRNRITLFLFAVFIALVTNWVRVFVIVYVGYVTEMQSSLISNHDFFGWILFAVALVPVFILAGRLERGPLPAPASSAVEQRPEGHSSMVRPVLTGLTVGLLLLTPISVLAVRDAGETVRGRFSLSLDPLEGWHPLFQSLGGLWEPEFSGEDFHNQKAWFKSGPAGVEQMPDVYATAHVLTYENQRPGKELVHDRNHIVDTDEWRPGNSFDVMVNGQELSGLTLTQWETGQKAAVIYGFYVSGHWTGDPVGAKLLQLYSAVNGRPDASLVAVSVHCGECDARETATAWFDEVMVQAEAAIDRHYGKEDN